MAKIIYLGENVGVRRAERPQYRGKVSLTPIIQRKGKSTFLVERRQGEYCTDGWGR
jgi:hypothetical protein